MLSCLSAMSTISICVFTQMILLIQYSVAMAKQFADRTHFVHLRSCYIFPNGNFTEASHLGGRGHLIELCRIFEKAEQEGKCNSGRRLPMRVDHGMTFTDEPGGVFDESNHGHNQTAGIL